MDPLPSDEIESSPPPNPPTITSTSNPMPGADNQPPPIPQQQDLPTQSPSSPLPDSHPLQTLESADPDPPNQDPDLHHLQDDPDDPEGMPITLISDSNVEEMEIEILPPSSSSRRAPPRRKKGSAKNHPKTLAAIEKKVHVLTQKWKVIPFVRNKALDFSRHEENLRRLGLWEFAHLELDRKIRADLLAKLIVTYNSNARCSFVDGVKVRVTPTDLARALSLWKKPKPKLADSGEEEEVWPRDFVAFVDEFVSNWMLLHEDAWFLPKEVLNWTGMIKEGRPEKVDWTKLIWFMVRRELSKGPELENCYYASHLQQLIRFQRKELLREKSPKEVQEVIVLKEDEDEDEEGDVKMAECGEVSHGGEPEMKLENVQPSVGGICSVQSEQRAENVVNLGVVGNVSDGENVGSLAHDDFTAGCVGGVENPETAGGHVENLEKAVEHVEIPEKAVEHVEIPEKAVECVGSPENAVERVESPEKAVECVGNPEKAVERVESPEKAVERVEIPEKAVAHVEIPDKAVEHLKVPETAVEHVEIPETAVENVEKAVEDVENPEKAVEHVEIPDKPVESVEKAVEHVENPEKADDQEENMEMAVDQLENMGTVGDHVVNLDNTGGHVDKLETATDHVDKPETFCDQVQKLEEAGDLVTKLEAAGDLVEDMNVVGDYVEDMKIDGDNVDDTNITGGDEDVCDFKTEDDEGKADDAQIQGTSGNELMDFEPIKADDEQDLWDLSRKNGEQGHFLRHCTMSEVEVDEEHAGQEDGQPEEVEDDEEEDDEQVEGFDALQKCNSFNGLSSGHLMQAMDPSQMQYAASEFSDQSALELLSSRGDNHLMLGGPSSIFGNAPKRELEQDPEMPGHSLNDSHKRMRTEGPSWDQKPPDLDMCFDQMQQWLAKARLAYMSSQETMVNQQQMINYELGNKDHIMQQLKLSMEDQQRRHQVELARYDNELYVMNSVISGYRKALKSTQQNFAEYRKRAALPLEPLYKDAGVGGVVKSVADLEKERLKREEEDRVALIKVINTAKTFEEECSLTFKAYLERVEMLQARVPDIEKGVKLLWETRRKRKEASETVG